MFAQDFSESMDFPSVDLFDDEDNFLPKKNDDDIARRSYTIKICPLEDDSPSFGLDRDGLKIAADLAYYSGDYEKAFVILKQLHETNCKNQTIKGHFRIK